MNKWYYHAAIVLLLLGVSCVSKAGEPDRESNKPSAAELIEQIVRDESKVDQVRSLYLRFEGVTTRTPAALERQRQNLLKKRPGEKAAQLDQSDLWLKRNEQFELAFDEKRARHYERIEGHHLQLSVFDGVQATRHTKFLNSPQEQYSLSLSPTAFFEFPFPDGCWPQMGVHSFWFRHDKLGAERARIIGYATDYTLVGEADFHGQRCFVLENPLARRRVHVGIDDRRLHGLTRYSVLRDADLFAAEKRAAGREFANPSELTSWFATLDDLERKEYDRRRRMELFALTQPRYEVFAGDYREIAPGFWFPCLQRTTMFRTEGAPREISSEHEVRLVESQVNTELPERLFKIELSDGIQVYDSRYGFPLVYKQLASRTPEEWQKLVDEQKKISNELTKEDAARDELVGKPAPEFPISTWLNSEPLSIAALKGQVVVLDFWATWCGPCRPDLPIAERLHREGKDSGIVVVGVHAAGTEVAEIKKLSQELELHYPILVDLESPARFAAFGKLASQLRVHGLPHAFLIDREGRIAAHGRLPEMLIKAREIAARKNQ